METLGPGTQGVEGPVSDNILESIYGSTLEKQLAKFLASITNQNANSEVLANTPRRVLAALGQMTQGYHEDPAKHLLVQFLTSSQDIVVVNGIDFVSLCEHHLMPFHGTVSVAYVPAGEDGNFKVVGLSKIPRVVDGYARRLQLQERLTHDIGKAIVDTLKPMGALVRVTSKHGCLTNRGAMKPNAEMTTQFLSGIFRTDPTARAEATSLIT